MKIYIPASALLSISKTPPLNNYDISLPGLTEKQKTYIASLIPKTESTLTFFIMIKHFAHIQHNQLSFFRPRNLTTTDTNLQNINFTIRTAIRNNNTIYNNDIDLTHPELLKAHIEKDLIPFISKCNHDSTSPRLSIVFGGFFCKGNDKHLPHTVFTNKQTSSTG